MSRILTRSIVQQGSNLNQGYTIVNAELTTYVTGLTTPLADDQLQRLDTLISSVKTGMSLTALSDHFDFLYVIGGETSESSLRNLVKRSHDMTAVNSPVFTQYEGYAGDAASAYLNTNYNPSTNGVNWTQNNASFGIYIRTSRAESVVKQHGASTNTGTNAYMIPMRVAGSGRLYLNGTTFAQINHSDIRGLVSVIRENTSITPAKNKTLQTAATGTSSSRINDNLLLLAVSYFGTPSNHDDVQLSFAYGGKALNGTQLAVLFDAMEAYLDSLGKGVVS